MVRFLISLTRIAPATLILFWSYKSQNKLPQNLLQGHRLLPLTLTFPSLSGRCLPLLSEYSFLSNTIVYCDSQSSSSLPLFSIEDQIKAYKDWLRLTERHVTPECRNVIKKAVGVNDFERQRGRVREQSFRCLLANDYESYLSLVGIHISKQQFEALSEKCRAFTSEERDALLVTCWLVKTELGDEALRSNGHMPPSDTEEWLTFVAKLAAQGKTTGIPLVDNLPVKVKKVLEQAYCGAHLRHMLYAEGSMDMFCRLPVNGAVWECRWWLNILGFRGEEGYLDEAIFDRIMQLLKKTHEIAEQRYDSDKQYAWALYVATFSDRRSDNGSVTDSALLGRLCMMSGYQSEPVSNGLRLLKATNTDRYLKLTQANHQFMMSKNTATYTYVPAVLHSAVTYLLEDKNRATVTTIQQQFEQHGIAYSPVAAAVAFTCSIMEALYQRNYQSGDVTSLRDVAWLPNMHSEAFIEQWLEDGMQCHNLLDSMLGTAANLSGNNP